MLLVAKENNIINHNNKVNIFNLKIILFFTVKFNYIIYNL